MNYIVFDLEFNQGTNYKRNNRNRINKECPFEIIQIGAVKLNENFESISKLSRLISPKIYTEVNPFITKITGITMEDLKDSIPFKQAYEEFIRFIEYSSILCVWGMSDMKELFRNAEFHKLDTSLIPKEYINIQRHASNYLNCPKGTNIGLSKAVELMNIPIKNSFHDAFNDAYYTAAVFKTIYTEKIKPKSYNSYKNTTNNKRRTKNTQLDFNSLIKQFEKIFNRQMTYEEQSIIKLAYNMGNTNQFQVEKQR